MSTPTDQQQRSPSCAATARLVTRCLSWCSVTGAFLVQFCIGRSLYAYKIFRSFAYGSDSLTESALESSSSITRRRYSRTSLYRRGVDSHYSGFSRLYPYSDSCQHSASEWMSDSRPQLQLYGLVWDILACHQHEIFGCAADSRYNTWYSHCRAFSSINDNGRSVVLDVQKVSSGDRFCGRLPG